MASYEPLQRAPAVPAGSVRGLRRSARTVGVLAGLLVLQLAATVTLARVVSAARPDLGSPGPAGFEALIVAVTAGAAWLCLTWLTAGWLLVALAALPARAGVVSERIAERVLPPILHHLARGMLGVGVLGVPVLGAVPAHAAPASTATSASTAPVSAQVVGGEAARAGSPHPPLHSAAGVRREDPDPLPDLDRPAAGPMPHLPPGAQDPPAAAGHPRTRRVVVRTGDTLWDLAAHSLGPGASAARIAEASRSWYAANRAVVGPDPDLILPGQELVPPSTHHVVDARSSTKETP